MLTARRLGLVLALSGFALASFIVDLELPLREVPERLPLALALNVGAPCVMGMIGLLLGKRDEPGGPMQVFLRVLTFLPVAVVVAVLVAVQLGLTELWIALRRYGGLSLVAPLVALTWSRTRTPVPLTSPAVPSALRAPWTVPALFVSAAQVHIAHAVDFAHRNHEPALSMALGWLGAAALLAFSFADFRLQSRIQQSLVTSGVSRSEARDQARLEGFAAVSYIKRSLAWNIACAVLALGSVLWAMFNGGGTYDW